jgi:hypothetical protein
VRVVSADDRGRWLFSLKVKGYVEVANIENDKIVKNGGSKF